MYRDNFEACASDSTSPSVDDSQSASDLLVQLQPMLSAMACKLACTAYNQEDCLQDGALAVLTALSRSRAAKGSALHYAARYARGHLLNRRRWLIRREICEVPAGAFNEFNWDAHLQPRPDLDREIIEDNEATDRVFMAADFALLRELAARILTQKELWALELVHCDGYSPGNAATRIGVSAARISQLVASALNKVRKALPELSGVAPIISTPVNGPTASRNKNCGPV